MNSGIECNRCCRFYLRRATGISLEKVLELKLNQVYQNLSIFSSVVFLCCCSTAEPVLMHRYNGNETTAYKIKVSSIHPSIHFATNFCILSSCFLSLKQ